MAVFFIPSLYPFFPPASVVTSSIQKIDDEKTQIHYQSINSYWFQDVLPLYVRWNEE